MLKKNSIVNKFLPEIVENSYLLFFICQLCTGYLIIKFTRLFFAQLIFISCKYFDKIQFNLRTLNLWIAFRAYLLMRVQLILFFHIISGITIEYSNLMGSWGAPHTRAPSPRVPAVDVRQCVGCTFKPI